MTGGGFGGSVLALVDAAGARDLVARFERAFVCVASDGAREL